jgi:exosortase/archaeosortase family protein
MPINMIQLKSQFYKIPKQIRLFLGKALLIFLAWKLIYGFILYDSKNLDSALTTHIAEASIFVINSLGNLDGYTTKRVSDFYVIDGRKIEERSSAIFHHDRMVLHIANACNGLELMVLYIGFIICMPSKFWRKMLYIVLGIIILDLINILRCTGLIYLREYYHVYFQFAHRYLFNAMVYTATFIMWVIFSRKINFKNEVI